MKRKKRARRLGEKEVREVIAYHEAGHAVIARRLGVTVESVVMFSLDQESAAGAITESAAYKNGDRSGCEADVRVALAGLIAEFRAFPNLRGIDDDDDDVLRAQSLAVRIAYIIAGLPPPQAGQFTITMLDSADAVLKQLQDETSALVAECWPAIERVAEALTHRDVLLQSDLDQIMLGLERPT